MPWTRSEEIIDELGERLVSLRRDLHEYPELGFEEERTQGVLRAWLEEFGYEPRECAGTGLIADLEPAAGSQKPAIALRADIDALPINESSDLPYRSKHPGVAHKCGHDGHSVVMIAVAAALAGMRGELQRRVRLLFQPAEEGVKGGGGQVMVAEGALEGVSEVYGMHNWPGFPFGEMRVAAGPVMAEEHTILVRLEGRGGHASQPQTCRDPVAAAAQMVTALNSIASRGMGHVGGAVLSISCIQAGDTHNVIPSFARLQGTLRCFDEALRDRLLARVREVVEGTATAMQVKAQLEIERGFPILHNDADCADHVRRVGEDQLGASRVSDEGLPLVASEDFSYLAKAVPGAYFFMGAGRPGEDTPSCHHPDFDFDDELIPIAARVFLGLVRERCH
ncbi:MAG: M20 metallopeptidase family protein [Planctomycetota bacterium]|jgi:amidohydrolase